VDRKKRVFLFHSVRKKNKVTGCRYHSFFSPRKGERRDRPPRDLCALGKGGGMEGIFPPRKREREISDRP